MRRRSFIFRSCSSLLAAVFFAANLIASPCCCLALFAMATGDEALVESAPAASTCCAAQAEPEPEDCHATVPDQVQSVCCDCAETMDDSDKPVVPRTGLDILPLLAAAPVPEGELVWPLGAALLKIDSRAIIDASPPLAVPLPILLCTFLC